MCKNMTPCVYTNSIEFLRLRNSMISLMTQKLRESKPYASNLQTSNDGHIQKNFNAENFLLTHSFIHKNFPVRIAMEISCYSLFGLV